MSYFELQFAESFKAILVKSLYHASKSLGSFNEEKTAYRTSISYREQEIKLTNFWTHVICANIWPVLAGPVSFSDSIPVSMPSICIDVILVWFYVRPYSLQMYMWKVYQMVSL